ncbi:MAG TPA: [protein-PII] uridylyltransferase [Streptosporangiaceae bacterium]|nr:[protein-PII] uridylyltransferase [Streptosporangiaceae bacterium]
MGFHEDHGAGSGEAAGAVLSRAADRAARTAGADRRLAGLLGASLSVTGDPGRGGDPGGPGGAAPPGVALVAVGGYGRCELLPGSDLDVLLLHDGRPDIGAIAGRIWYPLWDCGVRLDHAVRTVPQARRVARTDIRAALGLLYARHVAGEAGLTSRLRDGVLADWRAAAPSRIGELRDLHAQRAAFFGELAFLLEPDLKEARGGLRDVHAIQALAAAWAAPAPGPRVRAAYELILDVRHILHEVTGRPADRLLLQEQDEVARAGGLRDADDLLRELAGAGRIVAYAADHAFRHAVRAGRRRLPGRGPGWGARRRGPERRPLADGVVEQDGEVVLARSADPRSDPVLPLRAAAAAAQAALPLAPGTLRRLAGCPPLPVPWPAGARDALTALLGAGDAAIGVWEALDQEGLATALIPEWERVRNKPQRSPLHRFTVDRHLVETAARAAAFARDVARPDLLLLAALLHDIGKGWPGDHSATGEAVARGVARRAGFAGPDADLVARAVRHHLLLPVVATRRDLDDPVTVERVARTVGSRTLLGLLHALAIADGLATGPAAWNDWKAGLVAGLVRRVAAVLAGEPLPGPAPLRDDQLALAAGGGPAAIVTGDEVTVVAPDRPGLLWQAAGVLASHRLVVRSANAASAGATAVTVLRVAPEYGDPPDAALVASDLRRMLEGRLDIGDRLNRRARAARPRGAAAAPPRVTLVDDASLTATIVEVRAHDEPGLLWRIGRALGSCGLDVRAARVETLGAEAVDVFYVTDGSGRPLTGDQERRAAVASVLAVLAGGNGPPDPPGLPAAVPAVSAGALPGAGQGAAPGPGLPARLPAGRTPGRPAPAARRACDPGPLGR